MDGSEPSDDAEAAEPSDPPDFREPSSAALSSSGDAFGVWEELARRIFQVVALERIEVVRLQDDSGFAHGDRVPGAWMIAIAPTRDRVRPVALARRRLAVLPLEGSREAGALGAERWQLRLWSRSEELSEEQLARLRRLAPGLATLLGSAQPPAAGACVLEDAGALLLAVRRRFDLGAAFTLVLVTRALAVGGRGASESGTSTLSQGHPRSWFREQVTLERVRALLQPAGLFGLEQGWLGVVLDGSDDSGSLLLCEALRLALCAASPHPSEASPVGIGAVCSTEVALGSPRDVLSLARTTAEASMEVGQALLLIGPKRYRAADGREIGAPQLQRELPLL